MSLFSAITGQDASHSASKAAKKNQKVQNQYTDLFGGAAHDYKDFHNALKQMGFTHILGKSLDEVNADPSAQVAKFSAGANEAAAQQASQDANFLRSQGFGDGLVGGAGANAFQQATTQTNKYSQQLNSPEYHLQQLMSLLQGVQGAQGAFLNPLQAFGQGAYSAPQQAPQSGGLNLSSIAQLAALFA